MFDFVSVVSGDKVMDRGISQDDLKDSALRILKIFWLITESSLRLQCCTFFWLGLP
jgi:hypothetical protein